MFKIKIILISIIGFLIGGCNNSSSISNDNSTNIIESKLERNLNPKTTIEQQKTLAINNNFFAFDIFNKLQVQENKNLFFSPYSISEALVMTYAGAKNETKSQIAKALHFENSDNTLHTVFNALDLHINHNKEKYTVSLANSIWPDINYHFKTDYLDTIKVNYGAKLRLLDYENDTENSRQIINNWVKEKTYDKIENFISEDSLNSLTRLVLINIIYFKAEWLNKFNEYNTKKGNFTKENEDTIQVKFMQQINYFNYKENDYYQAISLPYEENLSSMLIILPKEGKYDTVIENINNYYNDLVEDMSLKYVNIKFPKFKFTTKLYNLKPILKNLGMINAFDSTKADFSLMTNNEDLFISKILHKAFIQVDENGSEATSATAIISGLTSTIPIEEQPIEMFINRPFIFFIKDNINQQILFMGLIKEPRL